MTRIPWREPAWYARPASRLWFLTELAQAGVEARLVKPPRRHRGGFAVRCTVSPPGIESRIVTIVFSPGNPEFPRVYADGPTTSPHRYPDTSLCIWFPFDGPDRIWLRRAGAAALVGHIAVHLIKEEWWRRTGEWLGAEAPHEE